MKFGRSRRESKLHEQWVKHAYLPSEPVPPKKKSIRVVLPTVEESKRVPLLLYILFGISIAVLCVGLILLLLQSC